MNQSQDEAPGTPVTTASLMVPSSSSSGRPLSRAQSAGSDTSSPSSSTKKSRFLLRRQDCLEKGELDIPIIVKSSPNSPLMFGDKPSSPPPSQLADNEPSQVPQAPQAHTTPILTKQRSAPLMNDSGLPPLLPRPPPYSPSNPLSPAAAHAAHASAIAVSQYHGGLTGSSPSPIPLSTHKLPSVRVIPDETSPEEELTIDLPSTSGLPPTTSTGMGGGAMASTSPRSLPAISDTGLLHPNFNRAREPSGFPNHELMQQSAMDLQQHSDMENLAQHRPTRPASQPESISTPAAAAAGSSPRLSPPPFSASMSLASLLPNMPEQFGHCPKARDGPALGCNYCWNTTDINGRILRRKTKYHCPDCQANLCIVPCFQAYHEAMEKDKGSVQSH